MEDLLKVLVSVFSSIVVAGGGLVIAWLHNKTKKLEAEKKVKDTRIQELQNGFREYVYKEISGVKTSISELTADVQVIKKYLVKEPN